MLKAPESGLFGGGVGERHVEAEAHLRERGAAHHVVLPNGIPVVWITGYDEARAALKDPRLRKDVDRVKAIIERYQSEASAMFGDTMLFKDGEAHTRLRKLVAGSFTKKRVEDLRPRVEEITDTLLEGFRADEPVDLIADFAFLLPLTVICELLGVPEADRAPFRGWTEALMSDKEQITLPASRAMSGYFNELITAKRERPGDDLLSALTLGQDGEVLTQGELVSMAILLLVAGHETTTNAIGHILRWLLVEPTRWRKAATGSGLSPRAVDEFLRHASPVRAGTHRYTAEEVTYGDVTIPADTLVLVSLVSANRDSRHFDHADELDLDRALNAHLAFGHGVHYCVGAPLARMEIEIALGALLERFPNACPATDPDSWRTREAVIMNGLKTAHTWLAGQPVRPA